MKLNIIATTSHATTTKEQMDVFSSHIGGICYMKDNFEAIVNEPAERTAKRINVLKTNGHHSCFDHCSITMYLEGIPRLIELILDNERMMTSSVKSGRYTVHKVGAAETKAYEKWVEIFKKLIADKYASKYPNFFSVSKIEKLALENARYLTGCFTLTSMMHTMSLRQFNYVYGMMREFSKRKDKHPFFVKLRPYLVQFLKCMEATGYIDKILCENGKNRKLSMFSNYMPQEYFGDVYATSYKGTFAYLCHSNRHRTILHTCSVPKKQEYYVPAILGEHKDLKKQWLADLKKLEKIFPQAMLVNISEQGTLDSFILRMYDRKCAQVLLETNQQVNMLLGRYIAALKNSKHPRADELEAYTKGSRCTWGGKYKCASPCGFADGINETRII